MLPVSSLDLGSFVWHGRPLFLVCQKWGLTMADDLLKNVWTTAHKKRPNTDLCRP